MGSYLLISSRDPFESGGTRGFYDLSAALAQEGHDVTLFLVQNGVLPCRSGPAAPPLEDLARAGVEVLADDFSLRERGIPVDRLAAGVKAAPLSRVVDHLAEGRKALWH